MRLTIDWQTSNPDDLQLAIDALRRAMEGRETAVRAWCVQGMTTTSAQLNRTRAGYSITVSSQTEDGRCPACGEDELDGGRCMYCGHRDYADPA